MKYLFLPALATVALAGQAQAESAKPFDLETQGNRVCKVGQNFSKPECFPSAVSQIGIPDSIDLVSRVRLLAQAYPSGQVDEAMNIGQAKTFGGALFITPNDRVKVLRYYRELSVRNIAVDSRNIVQKDGYNLVPFVASVRWKGALRMEGTLQVEGILKLSIDNLAGAANDPSGTGKSLNQILSQMFKIESYNDSSTELRKEPLRMVEKISRFIHFTRVYGLKESLDQDTQALLMNIVAPAIAGEVVILPMAESFGKKADSILR